MRHRFNLLATIALAAIFLPRAVVLSADPKAATQSSAQSSISDQPVNYIRAGHLVDVRAGRVQQNRVTVIKGEIIQSVASAEKIKMPLNATVIDLSHATVLPGRIDAHTHIFLTGELDGRYDEQLLKESWQYRTIEAVVNSKKDLDAGFTSMRDLETEGAMYSDVDVRNAINRGLIPGPRLQVATRALSTTGGYPLEGYSPEVTVPTGVQIVDGPDAARQAVREQIKYGADWIKVYGTHKFNFAPDGGIWSQPTFTLAELQAIVNEAHRENVKVACHAYGGEGLHNCIDAGVDSIEHGIVLDDSAVDKMLRRGIYLVPTLYVYEFDSAEDLAATHGKTSRAMLHEVSFKKALDKGVKIAFGTDAGPFPHGTQAKEFEFMVKFGMPPMAAIESATIEAAALMGWSGKVGALEPGNYADVIAVTGDPIADISELEHVKFVMKGGAVVKCEIPGK
jgi:imidazolonepropionase-like amidohydrolase